MVCDARRIKSVDPVIPLLSDEIKKSLRIFQRQKPLPNNSRHLPLHYFKLDFPHIFFIHDFIKHIYIEKFKMFGQNKIMKVIPLFFTINQEFLFYFTILET